MEFDDILYDKKDGVAKVTINRPGVHNAFRVKTLKEMIQAFEDAELDPSIGVIVLTGAGEKAFCTGGDVKETGGQAGYPPEMGIVALRFHELIRGVSKPVIAAVNGWAIGGGHVLHVLCDLTIASETARFGQVGPKVGSFDAGFGSAYLSRVVGEKKAKEIWFLCRQYTAQEALAMGLVNKVVAPDKLWEETLSWCREMMALSPTALKFLKASFKAASDSISGIEGMAAHGLSAYFGSDEALEGRKAFLERRPPDFSKFRRGPR